MVSETCTIDGFGPLPVVRPTSVADLGDVVRRAASEKQAIYPVGGQTQLGLGNPPTKPGIAVDMRGLDQVIDFPARDMTVTVQAGITIAKLQALLAPENLRLPIDVPQPERATLGGILATNVSGPRRFGYGTLRDYVIGISAVNDEGNEFKAGGRVVKNVAGYDLCKLLVGSLGTLGIISQVTLKLRPLAEESALVTLGCDIEKLDQLLARLHGSRTRPVCLELLNQPAARAVFEQAKLACPEARWAVVVGYEGNADAVNWQVQQFVKEVGAGQSLGARIGAAATALWHALITTSAFEGSDVVFKVSTLPSSMVPICQLADLLNPSVSIRAHAGNGIIHLADQMANVKGLDGNVVPAVLLAKNRMKRWLDRVTDPPGSAIVARCSSEWKSILQVWGPPPPDAWLMQQVKKQLDPVNLFNPGRFVAGI